MKIEKLLSYPVKGIRAIEVDSITVTKHGFPYERRFMLAQVKTDPKDSTRTVLDTMQVVTHPELVLFFPTMTAPSSPTSGDGEITVTFQPPAQDSSADSPASSTLTFPLQPVVSSLEPIQVEVCNSPTTAYRMPDECNAWFSAHLGYDAVLAYLGPHLRDIRFNSAQPANGTGNANGSSSENGSWWKNGLTSTLSSLLPGATTTPTTEYSPLTFTDVAPFLVVSSRSMDDVHHRLNGDDGSAEAEPLKMDITKFRPNVIISGAQEVWEEDFWRTLAISGPTAGASASGSAAATTTSLVCVHNCGRCNSINVDYATGKTGTGPEGKILKRLQRDRRVDPGMKYSPIFGRYAFLAAGDEGKEIRVGDAVEVTERNAERTTFDWKGLATL